MSRRQLKSFLIQQFFKNVGEVWASSPHLRSKLYLQQVFPAAIAFFEAVKFKQSWIMRIKAANSDKATGQLQHTGRQKQGWNPLLPDAEEQVFLRAIFLVATVPPEQLQNNRLLLRFHKAGRSCSPRLEKLSLFSPPAPCAKRMAQGFRCLRAAIRAARPEPRQHF